MMTEENQGHFPDEGYTHIPTGSLWVDEPSFARESSAEEWAVAAEFLRDFAECAIRVNDALSIAVVDAQVRCWAEHRRADEREKASDADKDRFGLSPGEHERLKALLHRCDAVNDARTLIEVHVPEDTGLRDGTLEELVKLYAELHEEFQAYKRELGVPPSGEPS